MTMMMRRMSFLLFASFVNFFDIFEPVLGLPPKRAIEFKINLIPGAQPITRPPYRMSNKENEEMRKCLHKKWTNTSKSCDLIDFMLFLVICVTYANI